MFSIGVYDALLGVDRSIPEVCKLINKPRTKKEAKAYYRIESEEVTYQAEAEDSVSETEIQNILMHYKKLGKNTERYVDSFNNIAAQYTDAQLRVISKFLPIGVRAVLETDSTKYQSIMTFGEGTYKRIEKAKEEKKEDLKIGFIETKDSKTRPTKPVVIPSAVRTDGARKLTKKLEDEEGIIRPVRVKRPEPELEIDEVEELEDFEELDTINNIDDVENVEEASKFDSLDDMFEDVTSEVTPVEEDEPILPAVENVEEPKIEEVQPEEPVKRKRGRPRKIVDPATVEVKVPKKRGRPRKVVEPAPEEQVEEQTILPGFDDEIEEDEPKAFESKEDFVLPGFDRQSNLIEEPFNVNPIREDVERSNEKFIENVDTNRDVPDISRLLTKDKKIVAFVGTAKAGTSFLVNNLADMLSRTGIKTALVDLTENRNSYYIYTKNEEPLRRIASNCLEKIESGIVEGIDVSKNLTVFTSVPNQKIEVNDVDSVVANLVKKYSLVLLDCDYKTDDRYFELAQEIYLVQTMDILTIQPLTAFLRDLQSSNKLDPTKLKVVINKAMKVRGLSTKAIVGGMSCYNNPEMSYMRELFDKDKIQTIVIPYHEDTLSKYLSGMVDCFVSTSGYSKQFLVELKKLGDYVYPLITNKFKPEYAKKKKPEDSNEWDF